jgi:integrase
VGDIDADRQRIHIRDAKGNKDRFVPLPRATLLTLRRHWALHRNPVLLFPNRQAGRKKAHLATTPLDAGGIQQALRIVIEQCGLKKELLHTVYVTAMPHI